MFFDLGWIMLYSIHDSKSVFWTKLILSEDCALGGHSPILDSASANRSARIK